MIALMLSLILAGYMPSMQGDNAPAAETEKSVSTGNSSILARDLLLRETTLDLRFTWRIPADVGLIPPLFHQMRADGEKTFAAERAMAAQHKAEYFAGQPFPDHYYDEEWAVEADTPRLLSLVGAINAHSGGEHMGHKAAAILWDKRAGRRIAFADLFTSWPQARAAIASLYCTELNKERIRRPGGEAYEHSTNCPPLDEQAITLFTGPDSGIDIIHIWLSSHLAGPAAEDSYELAVMLPESVLALVRPAYRTDFAKGSD